jgi:hypothetical protein
VAVVVFVFLSNDPNNAYFLNAEDKSIMQVRARQRAAYMGSEDFSWKEVKIALTDPKVILRCVSNLCVCTYVRRQRILT